MAHLEKARGFNDARNFPQTLRYSNLALTKLKQLKDRPIEALDDALKFKFNALNLLDHNREALECAKEWYCLHLTKHTHPPAIVAGFALIESCMHNKEFADAVLYARTTWETLTICRDSYVPEHQKQLYIAKGAHWLAQATWRLAESGGIPAAKKQEAGRETIMLARKALEMNTQLYGSGSNEVGDDMLVLAQILDFFNDVDDDEVLRLREQAKAIFARVQGSMSVNVAACEGSSGSAYHNRAVRAAAANDLNRCVTNLELALPRYREAIRIYRAANHVNSANNAARDMAKIEEELRVAKRLAAARG